jgi:hypothetical protein
MTNQSKRRTRISAYVLSTALIALGAASLSTVPTPAIAQQAPCDDPRVCPCTPDLTSVGGQPRCLNPNPPPPTSLPTPHAEVPRIAPVLPDFTPKNQAQNRLQ